jgi:hypothetical protein
VKRGAGVADAASAAGFGFRLPKDLLVEVRYWVVSGVNGTPHRVDSWRIALDDKGCPRAEFFYQEPESYCRAQRAFPPK